MEYLDKEVQGYKVRYIAGAALGSYLGYHTIKYAWWKYKNYQLDKESRVIV